MIAKPRPKRLEKRDAAKQKLKAWMLLRMRVFERDGWRCRVCEKATVHDAHHLLARSLGGKDELHNLLSVCRRCHEDVTGHVVWLRWRDDANRAGTLTIERVQ